MSGEFQTIAKCLGVALLFSQCSFHMDREAAVREFPPEITPQFVEYRVGDRRMGYVSVERRSGTASSDEPAAGGQRAQADPADRAKADASFSQPLIIFIHGSPGGWNGYLDYLRSPALLSAARLVSVDRAGYGVSMAGRAEANLEMQARLLAPIFENESRPVLLVGHSYGGPVAAQLAMDYPEKIGGLVLIAASVDPDLEEWRWFNQVAEWGPVRFLLPAAWDVSNQELKPLRDDLEAIRTRWHTIRGPVALVHGEEDGLVPVANVDFAQSRLQNARVAVHRFPDEDHFILWNRPDEMIEMILGTLKAID